MVPGGGPTHLRWVALISFVSAKRKLASIFAVEDNESVLRAEKRETYRSPQIWFAITKNYFLSQF